MKEDNKMLALKILAAVFLLFLVVYLAKLQNWPIRSEFKDKTPAATTPSSTETPPDIKEPELEIIGKIEEISQNGFLLSHPYPPVKDVKTTLLSIWVLTSTQFFKFDEKTSKGLPVKFADLKTGQVVFVTYKSEGTVLGSMGISASKVFLAVPNNRPGSGKAKYLRY